jgi:acetyl-CoA acetyltransferase
MSTSIIVKGTGQTRFGRHLDRSLKDLGREAVTNALADAQVEVADIDAIVFSNSLAGLITGQEMIRGEIVAFPLGFGTIPMYNVENACASGGNAVNLAHLLVSSGQYRTVLALGVEKAHHEDKARTFAAYGAAFDPDEMPAFEAGAGVDRTPLVDRQARLAIALMDRLGISKRDLAYIASRALTNASHNPLAHRQFGASIDDILNSRLVVEPIHALMSSPVSDGAAAAVITSTDGPLGPRDIRIAASRVATRAPLHQVDGPSAATSATDQAYADAGIGPDEIDVAEVHDASVAYELKAWHETGLCPPGDEAKWLETGRTEITGELPINPSGGFIGRGHALGASGIAQIHELVLQLRGEATDRQVERPRVGLAHAGGGVIGWDTAVASAHILVKD